MKKLLIGLTSLLFLLSCSGSKEEVTTSNFPLEWVSEKDAIEGQTYKVGIVRDTSFTGIFHTLLWQERTDYILITPITSSLLWVDESYQYTDGGMANLEIDLENKTVTYKLRDGLKWSDGHPLTVDDIVFAYEIVGHPEYTGVRYGAAFELVEGMVEYHEGKATTISGLEKKSDTELVVHLKEMSPGLKALSGGIMNNLVPKHYLENEDIATLESNEKVRLKPLSYGPFVIDKIVPGESVLYKPNPYFWDEKSAAGVSEMVYKIIPSSSVVSSMKNGEFDDYKVVAPSAYDEIKDLQNIAILGEPELGFRYIGFNLGHYDEELKKNVVNENAATLDLNLRKAMMYALNVDLVSEKLYKDITFRANGVLPPALASMYDKSIGQYPYDPEKAKKLLDEAGFKDVDGDGFRENQKGEPLVLKFAIRVGDVNEPLSQAFIQDWKAVGLNVELTNGRLLESNSFWQLVQGNSDKIDIWYAGWGLGSTLQMSNLFSEQAKFNFARYSDAKNEELLKKLDDTKFLNDGEGRIKAYQEWNKYYSEEILGMAPLFFSTELSYYNKRIKKASVKTGDANQQFKTQVVDKEPYKN